MAPTTASDVANYIICYFQAKGEEITHLKLQKLVYYTQAWFLALNNKKLFNDRFEAWIHGPVVRSLYSKFKDYSWKPILEKVDCPAFPENIDSHVKEVLDAYGELTAEDLEYIVHRETPWLKARGDLHPLEPSTTFIDEKEMKSFYKRLKQMN
jgi:uncharacterized phage-associated protein